jgi:hypothetical protein
MYNPQQQVAIRNKAEFSQPLLMDFDKAHASQGMRLTSHTVIVD